MKTAQANAEIASTHRHDHNPFAIAQAINSARRPATRRPTRQQTVDLATQRLHCLYQHLRQYQKVPLDQFESRLTGEGDLNDYPILLQAAEAMETASQLIKDIRALQKTQDIPAVRNAIASRLEDFDPPATPLTRKQVKEANAGLTKNQRNYRYRKESVRLSLGIIPFTDLFPDTHTTELFIAAHRWPGGKATYPHCGSEDTDLFGYLPCQEPHDPQFLTQAETDPCFGWDCQDCGETFITGTLMETPRVQPGDWLSLANTMLIHRGGEYELDLAHYAGQYHGITVSHAEARAMVEAIRQALSFAKPGVRQTISGLDALKTLVKASATPSAG